MLRGSCDNKGGEKRFSRLFFYFMAVASICILSATALCGCSDDLQNGGDDNGATESTITFVLNNGERDVVCHLDGEMPKPNKAGYYLYGWYADAGLTNKVEFAGLRDIISEENKDKFDSGEYRLYAKWQALRNMTGVRMTDAFFIYDGNLHGLEIEGLPDGAELEYVGESEYINAGEYEITATVRAYGYWDLRIQGILTIQKARVDLTKISFEDKEVDWDGSAKSIEITGELPGGVSVSYKNNGNTDAGDYEVIAEFDCGQNYESIPAMKATLTIKAKTYRIRFEEEDGTATEITVTQGTPNNIPHPKEKTGYTGRWNIEDFSNIREDITVYAVYEPVRYEIEYESNGGKLADNSVTEYTVEVVVLLHDAEREYYTFIGWYYNASCLGDAVDKIPLNSVGNRKYYAKWEATEYEIAYELNGGTNKSVNTNRGDKYVYTVESDALTLSMPTKLGYKFMGWKDEDGNELITIEPQAPRSFTLYAEWEAIRYTITYELNGGVNAESNPNSFTVEDGDIVLEDPEREEYRFIGWYDNAGFDGKKIESVNAFIIDDDIKLYAKWENAVFTVESIDGSNIITAYDYEYGNDIVINAVIDGKRIDGISSGVLCYAESIELVGFEDINVEALSGCSRLRELKLPATLNSMPQGLLTDCVALENLTVPYTTTKRLSAKEEYYPLCTLFGRSEKENCYEVRVRTISVTDVSDGNFSIVLGDFADYTCYVPNSLKAITVLGGEVAQYTLYGLSSVVEMRLTGVSKIGAAAMRGCKGLERVILSEDITEVKGSAFTECESLKEIYIHGSTPESILNDVKTNLQGQDIAIKSYDDINDIL